MIQVCKSEQINSYMQMVIDYDQPLTTINEKLKAFKKILGDNVKVEKYQRTKCVFLYEDNGVKHYIIAATLTYLSKPHPIFKKRMQLQHWHRDFYNEHKDKENETINLMGIYHYDEMEIYCDFNLEDYINKKMHSSSAHIYTNDLFQAVQNGIFEKVDMNGNRITAIKGIELKNFFVGSSTKNPIISLFEKFNSKFEFNKWLMADSCIKEMSDAKWYQAKGVEWPGWFLEFRVNEFIQKENCSNIMFYTGNKNKAQGMLDFDLFFGTLNFYGDLKASDINKKEAPGNDKDNTLKAISQYGKLWYIIYEHETIKDIEKANEMAMKRMRSINPTWEVGDHVSYKSRMKHSVFFKRMRIFELNSVNMHKILSDFNQGHNAGPSMADRVAKFLLNKNNMNNSVIFTYNA